MFTIKAGRRHRLIALIAIIAWCIYFFITRQSCLPYEGTFVTWCIAIGHLATLLFQVVITLFGRYVRLIGIVGLACLVTGIMLDVLLYSSTAGFVPTTQFLLFYCVFEITLLLTAYLVLFGPNNSERTA